jgi:ribonuclease Z
MLSSQVDRDDPLYIIGPPKIAEYIEFNRRVLDMYINYEIIVQEISSPGIVYKGDGFHVRCFPLSHTKPCYGYTLEEDKRPGEFHPQKAQELNIPMGKLWGKLQKGETIQTQDGRNISPEDVMGPPRQGRKFSFVTDTLPVPEISTHIIGSDLFICEGMFGKELTEDAHAKKHMTAEEAAKIAASSTGVKKLALIHYSPRYTEYELKKILDEAQAVFQQTVLTKDRMVFPIEYVD